jgi:hypothetical protein
VSSPGAEVLIFGCCCFAVFGRGCGVWVGVRGGGARGGGQVCGLPVTLPGGAVEACGSRVLRKRHCASDAEGALDLGGTASQAARHHRGHSRTPHQCCLGREGGRVRSLGVVGKGRVACSRSGFPGVDRPVGGVGHPFAARGGMECCDRVRPVGVNQMRRLATGWES